MNSLQTATPWRLDGSCAQLECAPLNAVVNVESPARGLVELRFRGAAVDGSLLGVAVDASGSPTDSYVRGNDLVVVYREKPERPFTVQVYWSASAEPTNADCVVLDATVSIQTRQWEAYPRVTVASHLPQAEVIAIDAAVLVMRPADGDWSYVEATVPGDFVMLSGGEGRREQGANWMFGDEFMERGVIRRLRLRGAIVPRAGDLAAASRLRDALAAEGPPLTA